jgi:hypothetical protein
MKKLAVAVVVAFAVTLAVIAGIRMSSEAVAVMMGMACGVVAGIPTSLLIAAVTNRRGGTREHVRMAGEYPPVVVIQPGQGSPTYAPHPYTLPSVPSYGPRQFHVVGDEATESSPEWGILH